jgi:hypothetical protein
MPCKRTIPRVCGHCQSDFLARPDLVKQGKALYCSVACRGAARRGIPSPLLGTGHTITVTCEQCWNDFRPRSPHQAKPQRFCSLTCKWEAETNAVVIPEDERDLIYMAGLIDGEGTITANYTTSPATGRGAIHCRVIVANTHRGVMQWVHETFGGHLNAPSPVRKSNHKPVQTWYAGSSEAVHLCQRLLPYLKIKRRQAEILIELGSLSFTYVPGERGRFVSAEIRAARRPLIEELRALNHRGIPPEDCF